MRGQPSGNANIGVRQQIYGFPQRRVSVKLDQGERSVLAYFPSSGSAQKAAEELKDIGYQTVQVDRISRYGVNSDSEINSPVGGQAVSNTGLTLFSSEAGELDVSERILHMSDPSVSGYGDTDYGMAGGRAFLVTVVTDEGSADQVSDILQKHGGKI